MESAILVGSLGSKESKSLVSVSSNAIYASGHLLYVREQALVAQAFDPDRLAVRGEPVTIAPGVLTDERFSRSVFSASGNGVLVYQTGKGHTLSALRWFDRNGAVLGTVGEPAQFFDGGAPNISPDGKRATTALVDVRTGAADVWLVDLSSGTRNRFTSGPGDKYFSAWTPDGRHIAHNMRNPAGGGYDIFLKSTVGSGAEEKLLADVNEWEVPTGFSPDGRFLIVQKRKEDRDDLFVLPLEGERTLRPVVTTPALETMGQFSPNGRYIAYVSDESGREEIYVTPFPGLGRTWQVSQNGGTEPRWRGDGKELFFFAPDNRLIAAQVKTDGGELRGRGLPAALPGEAHGCRLPVRRVERRPAIPRQQRDRRRDLPHHPPDELDRGAGQEVTLRANGVASARAWEGLELPGNLASCGISLRGTRLTGRGRVGAAPPSDSMSTTGMTQTRQEAT